MKRFTGTIVALLVFVTLLAWVWVSRGRVPSQDEVFRHDIAKPGELTKIQIVQYENAPAVEPDEAEQSGEEESADEDEDEAVEQSEGEGAGDSEDGKPDDKPKKKAKKRVEKSRLTLERRGDEWYAIEPFEGLVDPDSAESLVKTIVEFQPAARPDENPANEEFGLGEPTMEVVAWLGDGTQIRISLGEDTPVGAKVYAKIEGKDGLFLAPSMFKTDMAKEPDKIRDKKLARFEKDDVIKVTLTNGEGTVVAEKRTEGEDDIWRITSPGSYKGDEWAIESAFGKTGEVEATEFAQRPKDLKRYGLDKPRAQCKIELKDGGILDIAVGKQIKKMVKANEYSEDEEEKTLVYAMRKGRPEVLLVESTLFADLDKDLMALRDKHILDFQRDDVLSMKVARKKGLAFQVMRAGDDWTMQTPGVGEANRTKVDDILWDLTDLEAKEYIAKAPDLKQIGLAVPSTVITLKLKGNKTIKIKFGDEIEGGEGALYYCQTSESKQVYKVGDLAMKDLPETVEDLKEGGEPSSSEPDFSFGADGGFPMEGLSLEDFEAPE